MQQPKIKISQHNAPPDEKCVYFKLNNYFSELRTEVDKARARSNLGILSEYANTWENIIGKPDISSLLDTLKQQIVSTYNLGNLAGSLQDIRSRILQLETKTEGIDQNTITDVNKLWSDVARNSRDILALQSGGDTSLITRVASLEEQMANIGGTSATINNIITRLTALENNSGSQTDLTEVWSAIHTLQSAIASDQIESISLSQQTLNVDVNAGNQSIIVYAKHSRLTELENVTAQCTCNTSDLRVAYWNNEEDKVVIVGTGRCVLTFSYAGLTTTLSVEVTENGSQTVETTYYISYAPASALINGSIVGSNQFGVKNSSGTIVISGDEINKYSGCDLGNGQLSNGTCLIFCLPQGKSLQSWLEIFNNEPEQVYYQSYSNGIMLGDVKYNVYYITPASYNGLSYKFIIS